VSLASPVGLPAKAQQAAQEKRALLVTEERMSHRALLAWSAAIAI
jgi:hypothetical protein